MRDRRTPSGLETLSKCPISQVKTVLLQESTVSMLRNDSKMYGPINSAKISHNLRLGYIFLTGYRIVLPDLEAGPSFITRLRIIIFLLNFAVKKYCLCVILFLNR